LSSLLPAKWRWLVLCLSALVFSAHADKAPRPPHWSTPIDNHLNLHQVDAKLYRSALPTTGAVDQLKALGIVSVVNFYQKSDASWIGSADLQEIHLPMRTRWFDDEDALDALRSLRAAQEKGPVLIHCKHGQNRTGLVAALYRMVYQGWAQLRRLKRTHETRRKLPARGGYWRAKTGTRQRRMQHQRLGLVPYR